MRFYLENCLSDISFDSRIHLFFVKEKLYIFVHVQNRCCVQIEKDCPATLGWSVGTFYWFIWSFRIFFPILDANFTKLYLDTAPIKLFFRLMISLFRYFLNGCLQRKQAKTDTCTTTNWILCSNYCSVHCL